MTPFVKHEGLVVAIPAASIDTDILIPKQYLKRVERAGLADYLFDRWRYLDRGNATDDPYVDCAGREPDPAFALNQARHAGATVLVTGANFGCGSSREQAVWGLVQWGIRAVIAPSFGDIFFNNCFANGLLPIVLASEAVDQISLSAQQPGWRLAIDLGLQTVTAPDGTTWHFEMDAFRKTCLLNGADAIALTLAHAAAINAFEQRHAQAQPWLAADLASPTFQPPLHP